MEAEAEAEAVEAALKLTASTSLVGRLNGRGPRREARASLFSLTRKIQTSQKQR